MTAAPVEHDIVALYREVERLTGNMLSAAHQQDWDQLVALEAGCARCVESIKGCQVSVKLSEDKPMRFGTSFSILPISRRMSRV